MRDLPVKGNTRETGKNCAVLLRENLHLARQLLGGPLGVTLLQSLKAFSKDFKFSLRAGELQLINGSWYVTHTGLLGLARRRRCRGIHG